MRMLRGSVFAACLAIGCISSASRAAEDGSPFAVGARFGTLGLGGEVTVALGDYVNLRGVGHLGDISLVGTFSDVEYDVDIGFQNAGAMLDFHLPDGGFRWSVGIYYNGNDYDGTATPTDSTTIGGISFTPDEIGTITGDIQTGSTAYYAGIGFGNPVGGSGRWTVTLDVGVWILADDPTIELVADGTASSSAIFQSELDREEDDIENDLINWWPVIEIGVSYRF